jgi:hypothetical protein
MHIKGNTVADSYSFKYDMMDLFYTLQKFSCKHYEIVSEKIADGRQSKVGGYL